MFVFLKVYMLKPNHKGDGIRGCSFRRSLDLDGRALVNGVSALIKEAPERDLALSTQGGHWEKNQL